MSAQLAVPAQGSACTRQCLHKAVLAQGICVDAFFVFDFMFFLPPLRVGEGQRAEAAQAADHHRLLMQQEHPTLQAPTAEQILSTELGKEIADTIEYHLRKTGCTGDSVIAAYTLAAARYAEMGLSADEAVHHALSQSSQGQTRQEPITSSTITATQLLQKPDRSRSRSRQPKSSRASQPFDLDTMFATTFISRNLLS